MAKVDITYRTVQGFEPFKTDSETEEVDFFDMGIVELDLNQFTNFIHLKRLYLHSNRLMDIDLSPLVKCTKLEGLWLDNNNLKDRIDLAPLQECKELRKLDLSDNKIANIDLSPLAKCTKLSELDIRRNPLKSIDLTPLFALSPDRKLDLRIDYDEPSIEIKYPERIGSKRIPRFLKGFFRKVGDKVVKFRKKFFGLPVMLIPLKPPSKYTYVSKGYTGLWIRKRLLKHLPIVKRSRFDRNYLGLYGRIVDSANLTCYQYLFVWSRQLFPPHPMDYAPLFVYEPRGRDKRVCYDTTHYKKGWKRIDRDGNVQFWVDPFFHAFWHPKTTKDREHDSVQLDRLTDTHLKWWEGKEGSLKDWWDLEDDNTPFLKIDLQDPLDMIWPDKTNFASASPIKTPLSERLVMEIYPPFFASVVVGDADVGVAPLYSLLRLIDPLKEIGMGNELVYGYVALVSILHSYGLVKIVDYPSWYSDFVNLLERERHADMGSWMQLLKDHEPVFSELTRDMLDILSGFTSKGSAWLNEVRDALLKGDEHGILQQQMKEWHSGPKEFLRHKYSISWEEIIDRMLGAREKQL